MLWKPIGEIICWQECTTPAVRDELRAALPGYDHETFADRNLGPGMNTMSWRRDTLRLVSAEFRKGSEPKEGVSPTRYVNWLVLEHLGTGQQLAAVNCHFVSKAFWDPPEPDAEWRKEQWHNNMRVLREVITELRADDLPVMVGGDFNRAVWDLIGPDLVEPRYREGRPTVDRVAVTTDIEVVSSRLGLRSGSNHQPVIAELVLPVV
ncbi:endonuclease/exonuclease/phosphatase family protein [Nocardioides speluncae]|uniref:endonuclease/exonuclease/phosphatase family protein n=1 Tax=Nocardioides speluncae TaxID=2670337 RepID=UPI000D69EFB7|nr:endonuclease/exonuclease/phosphatase family protein [Nocardioides speluncae]